MAEVSVPVLRDDRPELTAHVATVEIDKSWDMNRLVGFMKRVLLLPMVARVTMTPEAVEVVRLITPTEDVLPKSVEQVELPLDALLTKPVELLAPHHAGEGFVSRYQRACDLLAKKDYVPSLIVGPRDPSVLLHLLPMDRSVHMDQLFGTPIQHRLGPEFHNQFVLFGGPTSLFDDISVAVSIDITLEMEQLL